MITDDTARSNTRAAADATANTPIEGIRHTLSGSTDPRVARTRAAILAAVHRLLAAGHESVSVTDIVRESGISRSSFYSHFASLTELAISMLGEEYARIAELDRDLRLANTVSDLDAMRLSQERLVDHYVANRALYAAAVALSAETDRRAASEMAAPILENLRVLADLPPQLRAEIASVYIANAAVGLLHAWLRGEVEATRDQLVTHLVDLLPPWFSHPDQTALATDRSS